MENPMSNDLPAEVAENVTDSVAASHPNDKQILYNDTDPNLPEIVATSRTAPTDPLEEKATLLEKLTEEVNTSVSLKEEEATTGRKSEDQSVPIQRVTTDIVQDINAFRTSHNATLTFKSEPSEPQLSSLNNKKRSSPFQDSGDAAHVAPTVAEATTAAFVSHISKKMKPNHHDATASEKELAHEEWNVNPSGSTVDPAPLEAALPPQHQQQQQTVKAEAEATQEETNENVQFTTHPLESFDPKVTMEPFALMKDEKEEEEEGAKEVISTLEDTSSAKHVARTSFEQTSGSLQLAAAANANKESYQPPENTATNPSGANATNQEPFRVSTSSSEGSTSQMRAPALEETIPEEPVEPVATATAAPVTFATNHTTITTYNTSHPLLRDPIEPSQVQHQHHQDPTPLQESNVMRSTEETQAEQNPQEDIQVISNHTHTVDATDPSENPSEDQSSVELGASPVAAARPMMAAVRHRQQQHQQQEQPLGPPADDFSPPPVPLVAQVSGGELLSNSGAVASCAVKRELTPVPAATQGISDFAENDVLSGRGGGTNVHPGNRNFRDLINTHRRAYLKARKNDKPAISRAIVRSIRETNGRFLKKCDHTGLWLEIGDDAAREKTSQALRQRAPEMRRILFDEETHIRPDGPPAPNQMSTTAQHAQMPAMGYMPHPMGTDAMTAVPFMTPQYLAAMQMNPAAMMNPMAMAAMNPAMFAANPALFGMAPASHAHNNSNGNHKNGSSGGSGLQNPMAAAHPYQQMFAMMGGGGMHHHQQRGQSPDERPDSA